MEIKQKICINLPAVENLEFLLIPERKTNSIHSYSIIRKGRSALRSFRMQDMWIDNDQIVPGNGKPLIFYKKFAASSGNIKKLRKSVGMGNAGPVLFVSGG